LAASPTSTRRRRRLAACGRSSGGQSDRGGECARSNRPFSGIRPPSTLACVGGSTRRTEPRRAMKQPVEYKTTG
jgi:hypothetical protein